jgi:hypothetical protein
MNTKISKRFVLVAGLAIAVIITVFLTGRDSSSSVLVFPSVPVPNSYDEFLRVAQSLVGQAPDLAKAGTNEIRSFVEPNRAALDPIRSALQRECLVPLAFSQTYLAQHMPELGDLKKLAQFLVAAGKSAELSGRKAEAIECYLDAVRLGESIARGGLIIDLFVSQASQAIGLRGLRGFRENLTEDECSEVLAALEAIDSKREPVQGVLDREKAFFRKTEGLRSMIGYKVLSMMSALRRPQQMTVEQQTKNTVGRARAQFHLFLVELALQIHKTKNGTYPQNLAELSPALPDRLFKDPFSNGDFIYKREENGYVLYSVGPDRKDDGGKALSRQSAGGVQLGDILPE